METAFLEDKIKHIEHELQEVKSMLSNSGKNKKSRDFLPYTESWKAKRRQNMSENLSEKQAIILGDLLHDVGNFGIILISK